MKSNTAVKRAPKIEQTTDIDSALAKTIATSWLQINAVEEALARMDTGIVQWRGAPAVQNAMAAIVSDMLEKSDTVKALGFQPYAWAKAAACETAQILETQLGKALPQQIIAATADDITASMQHGTPIIVSIHAENKTDWNDVRVIAGAAVKAETPLLMLVSAGCEAPKGVAIEMISNWAEAATEIRTALESVRNNKAIRVIAVEDMDAATIENAMMQAAEITVDDWQNQMRKNADAAEIALLAAYRAPVKY